MSRRILPLPEDPVQDDSRAVAPTQENLRANSGILRAENLLKQKGWRVMALEDSLRSSCSILQITMLMTASTLIQCCRRRTHFSSSIPLFFSQLW